MNPNLTSESEVEVPNKRARAAVKMCSNGNRESSNERFTKMY